MRTRHDVALSLGAQVGGLVLGLGAAVVTARVLGPTGQGQLQVAQSIAATGAQVVSMSVPITVVQLIARRELLPGAVMSAAAAVTSLSSLAVIAVIGGAAGVLAERVLPEQPDGRSLLLLAAALAGMYGIQISLLALFRGRDEFRKYNLLVLVGKASSAAALLAAMVTDDPSARDALTAVVAANVAFTAVLLRAVHRSARLSPHGVGELAGRVVRSNLAAYGGTLVQEITYRADVVLLAVLATSRDVGHYAVALLVAELLWQLPNAAGLVLLSRAAHETVDGATGRLATAVASVTFVTLVGVGIVVAVVAPVLVPAALGDDYRPAVAPVVALLPGIAALGLWKVVVNDLAGRGHPRSKLTTAAVGAVLVVGLDVVLIPDHGATGAAVASSIAYTAAAVAAVAQAARILDRSPRSFVLPDAGARAAVADVLRSPRSLLGKP